MCRPSPSGLAGPQRVAGGVLEGAAVGVQERRHVFALLYVAWYVVVTWRSHVDGSGIWLYGFLEIQNQGLKFQ